MRCLLFSVQLAQCQLLLVKLLFVQYTVLLTLRDKRFCFLAALRKSRNLSEVGRATANFYGVVLYVKSLNVVLGCFESYFRSVEKEKKSNI